MKYSLTAMARRSRNIRRSAIVLRDIVPPATMATSLFRECYLPVVQTWEAAEPRILAEYERTLAQLTTDSASDISAIISGVQAELQRLLIELTPRLRSWAVRVERWQRGKWLAAVLSATGVDLHTMIGPEDVAQPLEAIIEWNVGLIRDVGDQARQRISSSVFVGLQQRKPAVDVAREIREAVAMSRRRSIGIASDQLSKLTSSLASERRRQAGLEVWKWRHSGKLHPREWHKARDSNLYSESAERIGTAVEGRVIAAEPAADDLPGRPPWCGCREQAVVVFD